jgi:hypothetical protein
VSPPPGRRCPAPGCTRTVPSGYYACRVDWRRIPPELKTAVLRAWGRRLAGAPGATQEHEDAKAAADTWLVGHPR